MVPTNKEANRINLEKLIKLRNPIVRIEAKHVGKGAKNASPNKAMCLQRFLFLAKGARIMLRHNLWTEAGLVNGAMGTVHDIVYKPSSEPGSLPAVVLVKFDAYTGPSCLDGEERIVPICPRTSEWFERGLKKSRTQLPINLSWSVTIHKAQGATLDKAVIDVGSAEKCSGLAYVALSRVKTCAGVALMDRPEARYKKEIRKTSMFGCRLNEEKRMNINFHRRFQHLL